MKEAKLKFKPGNFEVISTGDYVICKVSGKKIDLSELKYWNVELQEPYFSYVEAAERSKELNKK
ncbi:MAG: DUF2093 domain-containing protein [Pseudomonadota bacterium]|jgi:hypothetical protein